MSNEGLERLLLSSVLISAGNCNIFNEPRHGKTGFLHMQKQSRRSAAQLTSQLISGFVFDTQIVQSLYLLNPKFQAPSHFL